MESFDKIRQSYLDYAKKSLSLEGVAVEKLCTLLAFSTYKNQILQLGDTLESSFSSSTKLNSRIFHAANSNYSVFRGKCPIMSVFNLRVAENKSVEYLDQALFYNGYYFYFTRDYKDESAFDINSGSLVGFDLLCSTKIKGSVDVNVTGDIYSIEISNIQNVSSDYRIIEHGTVDKVVSKDRVTEDSAKLYLREKVGETATGEGIYEYCYDYLVTTIPSYGVKITRRADTQGWGDNSTSLTFEYIPYSETTPDITNLTSIPGFAYVSEYDEDKDISVKTEIVMYPFQERMTDLNKIYSNAMSSVAEQNSVVTEEDLLAHLSKQEGLQNSTFVIYTDTDIHTSLDPTQLEPDVLDSPLISTLVYFNVENITDLNKALENFQQTFSVPRTIQTYEATGVNFEGMEQDDVVYVEAFPKSKELTNTQLTNLCNSYHEMIGQTLTHAKFEADIVKLGFDYVKVYVDEQKTTELTVDANPPDQSTGKPKLYKYPEIHAIVSSYVEE